MEERKDTDVILKNKPLIKSDNTPTEKYCCSATTDIRQCSISKNNCHDI